MWFMIGYCYLRARSVHGWRFVLLSQYFSCTMEWLGANTHTTHTAHTPLGMSLPCQLCVCLVPQWIHERKNEQQKKIHRIWKPRYEYLSLPFFDDVVVVIIVVVIVVVIVVATVHVLTMWQLAQTCWLAAAECVCVCLFTKCMQDTLHRTYTLRCYLAHRHVISSSI